MTVGDAPSHAELEYEVARLERELAEEAELLLGRWAGRGCPSEQV